MTPSCWYSCYGSTVSFSGARTLSSSSGILRLTIFNISSEEQFYCPCTLNSAAMVRHFRGTLSIYGRGRQPYNMLYMHRKMLSKLISTSTDQCDLVNVSKDNWSNIIQRKTQKKKTCLNILYYLSGSCTVKNGYSFTVFKFVLRNEHIMTRPSEGHCQIWRSHSPYFLPSEHRLNICKAPPTEWQILKCEQNFSAFFFLM